MADKAPRNNAHCTIPDDPDQSTYRFIIVAAKRRNFKFAAAGPVQAHNLNDGGRLAVRKAAGEIAVAGLAVLAADTGRVLMLQRAVDPED